LFEEDFIMGSKVILSGICFYGLLAPVMFAEPPGPAARPVSHRIVVQPGSSYLGVGVAEMTSERAKELHLKDERGVEVRCVDGDSPAAKAGLKEGDIVVEYNGQRVEGGEQFMRLVRETPPGRAVNLVVTRNGSSQTLSATIGQRKSGSMAAEFEGDEYAVAMPAMPPLAFHLRMPDMPSVFMSWRSPMLGIESESLNPQMAEYFGVKEGVLVRAVTQESSADKAGLKAGDVIVKVGSEKVTSPKEISSILQSSRAKKTLPITVVRHQKEVVLNVVLEESSQWQALETRELL
jgi:serine protease Do